MSEEGLADYTPCEWCQGWGFFDLSIQEDVVAYDNAIRQMEVVE